MKKIISTFMMVIVFALFMPSMPTPTSAASLPVAVTAAEPAEFGPCPAGTYRVRKNTKRGRRLTNALIAGGIGAAIGGGIGGKRGALLGLGSGAGGYLVYRYVKDRRGRCVQRYVRG
jgi:hypothetical protein